MKHRRTDKPIIFSAPMVRALLDGRKTQTRRLLKPSLIGEPWFWEGDEVNPVPQWFDGYEEGREPCGASTREVNRPIKMKYTVGDRLWVREAHYLTDDGDFERAIYACDQESVTAHLARIDGLGPSFPEDIKARHKKLRPSIHMPRWASRLTLTVTDVRVERLMEISEDDARAEGCWTEGAISITALREQLPLLAVHPSMVFRHLWDGLHGPDAWDTNPWVVCLSFRCERRNIDGVGHGKAE